MKNRSTKPKTRQSRTNSASWSLRTKNSINRRSSVTLRAHAKINLFLRVGPKRPDGYHDILTLFQSISLADQIRIRCTPTCPGRLRIRVSDPKIPTDNRNTIHRAYRYLCDRYPRAREAGFDVELEKNIPAGTGLGGGSADAAAFLIGATRILGLRLPTSPNDFAEIASRIGADVPFCMRGGTAVGRRLGDRLRFLDPLPPRRIFLAVPATRVSTRSAYRLLDESRGRGHMMKNLTNPLSARRLYSVVNGIRLEKKINFLSNDFQAGVCRVHAELARIFARLAAFGPAAMTGSGSAFFVLPRAAAGLLAVRAAIPNTPVIEAKMVGGGVTIV